MTNLHSRQTNKLIDLLRINYTTKVSISLPIAREGFNLARCLPNMEALTIQNKSWDPLKQEPALTDAQIVLYKTQASADDTRSFCVADVYPLVFNRNILVFVNCRPTSPFILYFQLSGCPAGRKQCIPVHDSRLKLGLRYSSRVL